MSCQIGHFHKERLVNPVPFSLRKHPMSEQIKTAEALSLEALRSGDKTEIANLVEIFLDPVYRLALRMTGSEEDAEDITQETFIKIIKSLPSFEGRSQISTWIYRIAMNESLMNLRRRKPLNSSVEIDRETGDDQDEEIQIVDWAGQPEVELITSEAKQELDSAISRLPEGLRSVFILRDLQDLSIEDTSGVLGISTANVKTRLLRARLKLRQDLSVYYRERVLKEIGS
jgi:RNA polymerase sigma-70 factor (ECF subfamily)